MTGSFLVAAYALLPLIYPDDKKTTYFWNHLPPWAVWSLVGLAVIVAQYHAWLDLHIENENLRSRQPIDAPLYDRRKAAMDRYLAFLLEVPVENRPGVTQQFGHDIQEAKLLFGPEIYGDLEAILVKAQQLKGNRERKRVASHLSDGERDKLIAEENELVQWFTAQYGELQGKLVPFLDVADHSC